MTAIVQRPRRPVYRAGALLLSAALWLASTARAENLLTNGDFSSGFAGWTTGVLRAVSSSFGSFPQFVSGSTTFCVPSQEGNPFVGINVPFSASGYLEQAVEVPGDDAVLRLRSFGQLDETVVTVSIIDGGGIEHVLDHFATPEVIESYTLPGPVVTCSGADPVTVGYDVEGFGGQTITIRLAASSTGSDGTFALFDDVSLDLGEPGMRAVTQVDPEEVEPGDEFTLTITVTNTGGEDLSDVGPTGPVASTSEDGGEVEVLSGPVPASAATLAVGDEVDFVYQMKATHEGTVRMEVGIAGEDADGDPVAASAICIVPGGATAPQPGEVASQSAAIVASPAGECGTVTIKPPCTIELIDESPPIFVARATGRTIDVGGADSPALACGAFCKLPKPAPTVTRVGEIAIVQLETEARETTKNVGQEVKLKAKVTLREGLELQSLDWSVDGKTIEWYTDVSGYTAGNPDALGFTHATIADPLEKTTDPGAQGGDTLTFFWQDTGTFTVEVEAKALNESQVEFTCDVDSDFTVERNQSNPDRQPEDFFTSCCSDAPERVRQEHLRWHSAVDGTTPHAGDDWLNFHRAVVRVYGQWRELFGYPEVDQYDGSGPFPSTEAGFNVTEETRTTDTPQCVAPLDPRDGVQHPLRANCPMPAWFTAGGDGSARPLQEAIDGFDRSPEPFEYVPSCFRARNYDGDLCFPTNGRRLFPGFPDDDQVVNRVDCGPPPSLQGAVFGVPYTFEIKPDNRPVDLAGVGQTRLADFRDNVELGCIITKGWHVQMHVLSGGAMLATSTSPKDPIFYRVHQLLSGVAVPGAPITVYDFWEHSQSGAPGSPAPGQSSSTTPRGTADAKAPELTLRFPYPQYAIAALNGVAVSFWEPVTGVDPSDLLVGGAPATTVDGSGKGPYVFRGFPVVGPVSAAPGAASTRSAGHSSRGHGHGGHAVSDGAVAAATVMASIQLLPGGIQDAAGNEFAGDSWTVPVEPDGDGDGVPDSIDNCAAVANPLQENSDVYHVHVEGSKAPDEGEGHPGMIFGDELGDACDDDDDDDGLDDATEIAYGSDPKSRTSLPDRATLPGDFDGDGVPNAADACFTDPLKTAPGTCGCGAPDADSDGDGVLNCEDLCPLDALKIEPGVCGCAFDEQSAPQGGEIVCVATTTSEPVEEIPALSTWGLVLLALLSAGAGGLLLRARR